MSRDFVLQPSANVHLLHLHLMRTRLPFTLRSSQGARHTRPGGEWSKWLEHTGVPQTDGGPRVSS